VTTREPALSVVICALGARGTVDTAESIVASAELASLPTEVVVIWQGDEPLPALPAGARGVVTYPVNISHARNHGVAHARAQAIGFVDDDELVDERWVAAVMTALESADAVFGPIAPRDERGLPYCSFTGDEVIVHRGTRTPPWRIGTGGNMALRRAQLEALGGFDVRMGAGSIGLSGEDADMIARLQRAGATLRWQPDMVVYHPSKTAAERLGSRHPYGYGVGRIVARSRSPLLAARYTASIGYAVRDSVRMRSRRRAQETARTAQGFFSGLLLGERRWDAPGLSASRMPAEISSALGDRALEPWTVPWRGDPHFLYAAGEDLVLHVVPAPGSRALASLPARPALARSGVTAGIPAQLAAAEGGGALWIVEERLRGRHLDPGAIASWWGPAVEWVAGLATASGPPLGTTEWWTDTAHTGAAAVAERWRPVVLRALERVAGLPSVALHGDVQPKNLLHLEHGGIGAIDWETALPAGLPGLDLLFLALMARGEPPRADALLALAHGREPAPGPLLDALARVGVTRDLVAPVVIAASARWAADEALRAKTLGVAPQPPRYARLMDVVAPTVSGDLVRAA
jgi:hypothetical protein